MQSSKLSSSVVVYAKTWRHSAEYTLIKSWLAFSFYANMFVFFFFILLEHLHNSLIFQYGVWSLIILLL